MGSNFVKHEILTSLPKANPFHTGVCFSSCVQPCRRIDDGKHPNRVNITDWIPGENPQNRQLLAPRINNELALEEITIAEKLKEKGYATCFVEMASGT